MSSTKETKRKFLKKLLSNKSSKESWEVINKILRPDLKRINVDPNEVNEFFKTAATRTTRKIA